MDIEKSSKQKTICFRFDVDTPRCLKHGVPNLCRLGDELGVRFTFFVNTGRAVSIPHQLRIRSRGSRMNDGAPPASHLPASRKLGWVNFLMTAVLNPKNVDWAHTQLRQLGESNHEVGLHGGRNHEGWVRDSEMWSQEKLRDELEYGLRNLKKLGIDAKGFASPGWVSPTGLPTLLSDLDFTYFSDRHGVENFLPVNSLGGTIPNLGVELSAEPGGVAWVENMVARGKNSNEIVADFLTQVSTGNSVKVIYDHPYFAGIEALDLTRELVRSAIDQGHRVLPVLEAYKQVSEGPE